MSRGWPEATSGALEDAGDVDVHRKDVRFHGEAGHCIGGVAADSRELGEVVGPAGFRDPFGSADRTGTLASLLGFSPKAIQALAAPLQVFRRGEPLALMPNVFVR